MINNKLARRYNDELVYYLSYGVSIAGLLQLVFLYQFAKKFYFIRLNFNFKIDNKVKFFFKKLLPSIFSSGVTQINILVGTIIAIIVPTRMLICVTPEEKILGKSFLKKNFTLLSILKLKLSLIK